MPLEAPGDSQFEARLLSRLSRIYGDDEAPAIAQRLLARLQRGAFPERVRWDETDAILITYGNSLTRHAQPPLQTLKDFADTHLRDVFSMIHVLPFFPFSSDDGFAVIDYRIVSPMLGDWEDIAALGEHFGVLFDLVLNHVSSRSTWFSQFLGDRPPGRDYFIEVDPAADRSAVVRPRVQPVAAGFDTERGFRYVWATFSDDQIDLNFENPDVLIEMIDVFQYYLLQGARAVRLDAVAFLWKEQGTDCIHRPQTHEVVRLLRDVLEEVAPGRILLTETNVPHRENVSYFGDGDEAHMVYQFSLPPLLLHALFAGDGRYLTRWAQELAPAPAGCTFFNFSASHDGIGMRPVEGILPEQEVDALVAGMQRLGGFASARTGPGGKRSVYELNITYYTAMRATADGEDGLQVPRFLCSQLTVLGLQGIPAVYVLCLLATQNDLASVDQSGRLRSINRSRWEWPDAEEAIENPNSAQHRVFQALRHALSVRRTLPAFHPDVPQAVLDLGPSVFALRRGDALWALSNLTAVAVEVTLPERCGAQALVELLTGARHPAGTRAHTLAPYQVAWLAPAG